MLGTHSWSRLYITLGVKGFSSLRKMRFKKLLGGQMPFWVCQIVKLTTWDHQRYTLRKKVSLNFFVPRRNEVAEGGYYETTLSDEGHLNISSITLTQFLNWIWRSKENLYLVGVSFQYISQYTLKSGHISSRYEKLVKISGTHLTQYVYAMITYIQVKCIIILNMSSGRLYLKIFSFQMLASE